MMNEYNTRDAMPARRGRPPKHPPEPQVLVEVPRMVVKCPHCGGTQWRTVSGGRGGAGDTYKRCQLCGNVYVFQSDGMIRRSR